MARASASRSVDVGFNSLVVTSNILKTVFTDLQLGAQQYEKA